MVKAPYHARRIPVKASEAIVIPGGNAPQARVFVQQHSCGLEVVQEVRAEQHVILHYDGMAVLLLQKHFVQGPLVVLGQPGMPCLQTKAWCQNSALFQRFWCLPSWTSWGALLSSKQACMVRSDLHRM